MQFAEAGDRARRHDRGVAAQRPVIVEQREAPQVGEALDVVDPDVRTHLRPYARPETYVLEGPRVRLVDGRRSPAAQTAHERVRDHLHEPSGDRSVERVAAV